MGQYVKVARRSEIADQSAICAEIGARRIAVFNLGGEFFAIDDECTHAGGPLSEGMIEGEEVECPWHEARFNIKTGAACCDPADGDCVRYNVRVNGDDVEVEV